MSIFNSLGSNYNLKLVLASLFTKGDKKDGLKLKSFLEEKYGGTAILLYKGREALTLALRVLNLPKKTGVLINGFTCYAVYKAVDKAGYTPICLDLGQENSNLNFSPDTFEKIAKADKNVKVVVVQNTLGYPTDIEKVLKICRENGIFLIEDLAHCVGTKYENGKEAGSVGDFVALSFSQDKIIDAVSGGALIIKDRQSTRNALQSVAGELNNINNSQQLKDHLYPLFTYKIRFLYDFGLGKILHFILKKLNLLSKPMQEDLYGFYSLPNWYCNLALLTFSNLSEQLNHRRKIAQIYVKNLNKEILQKRITNTINLSSNLRFPIFVKNRNGLIKFLKKSKIFVSDIWYDDVALECPNAVEASKKILNLPTHINVNERDAKFITERINSWLKS